MLYAIRDAINRLNFACAVTVYTECEYIRSVISQGWLDRWQRNGWQNSRGREVADAVLWSMLLQDLGKMRHALAAVAGKHKHSEKMREELEAARTNEDTFSPLEETPGKQEDV